MNDKEAQKMLKEAKDLMARGTVLMEKAEKAMESKERETVIYGITLKHTPQETHCFYIAGGFCDQGAIKKIIDFWAECDPEIMKHLEDEYGE